MEALLQPIWKDKTETASRLRGRIEKVLDYAIVKGMMSPPNPAAWHGNLSRLLPSKNKIKTSRNQPALQLKDTQRWWVELSAKQQNVWGLLEPRRQERFMTYRRKASSWLKRGHHWGFRGMGSVQSMKLHL